MALWDRKNANPFPFKYPIRQIGRVLQFPHRRWVIYSLNRENDWGNTCGNAKINKGFRKVFLLLYQLLSFASNLTILIQHWRKYKDKGKPSCVTTSLPRAYGAILNSIFVPESWSDHSHMYAWWSLLSAARSTQWVVPRCRNRMLISGSSFGKGDNLPAVHGPTEWVVWSLVF
jgi:hypothetical protein